ncbi:MAG: hypothetical protein ABL934_10875 [Lysobacteraceae bacterium]
MFEQRTLGHPLPDNAELDYLYDTQGRVAEIGLSRRGIGRQVLLHNALYDPFGPVSQWTYGNGRVMTRTYSKSGQPDRAGERQRRAQRGLRVR